MFLCRIPDFADDCTQVFIPPPTLDSPNSHPRHSLDQQNLRWHLGTTDFETEFCLC